MNSLKVYVSLLGGLVLGFFEQYFLVVILVIAAIVFDLITGLTKAKITSTVSSKKSFIGVWKKISLLIALFFGIYLDFFIPLLIKSGVNVDIGFNLPFGIIVGVYIVLNECISICENLYQCGTPMPKFIVNALKLANSQVNSTEKEEK